MAIHLHKKPLMQKLLFFMLIVLQLAAVPEIWAQNRSRVVGQVVDASTDEPLIGVNIIIEGTNLGAATDLDGSFIIINVPVGKYEVKASIIGYNIQVVTNVMVAANQVADVEFRLSPAIIEGSTIEVVAQRPKIHREVSSTQLVVSDIQLRESTGIREINAFLTRLPGVSEDNGYLSIRGGSADQTGLIVNGMSYTNSAAGNAESSIPLSAIDQISLMSGGYNAEYGNFRSGLINVTTKSGSKKKYEGTLRISRNNEHRKMFGDSFFDPLGTTLRPFLDPAVAFVGTEAAWADDPYLRGQYPRFNGWNKAARNFNAGSPEDTASALDYYLLAAWMFMAIPDYDGLAEQGYEVSVEQKKLFAAHAGDDMNQDLNIDGGFGGPLPFIGKSLGDASFYISHSTKNTHFIIPMTIASETVQSTLATIKTQPSNNLTLTLNGLYKYQRGISPIRPAWGDFPDASREGGFMSEDNIKYFSKNPEYWYDQPFWPILEQRTKMLGADINYIINEKTFWQLSVSGMKIADDSPVGNNRDPEVITHFGPFPVTEMPYGKLQYGGNRVIGVFDGDTINYNYPSYDALPGVNQRFRRKEGDLYTDVKVSQYRAKYDLNSQLGKHHYFKTGVEYNYIDLDHNMWQKWNENYYNVYEFNYHRTPSQTGAYIQDQVTFDDIVANLGLRLDYYYGGGGKWPTGDPFATDVFLPQTVPSDSVLFQYLESGKSYIWDVWEAYHDSTYFNGVGSDGRDSIYSFLNPIKNHFSLSPRIGISFPVTANSKFYFNYGHFRSNPPYYTMYLYRYRYDKNGLYDMSNPNLEPPRTISYELGVSTNIIDKYILKLSTYSKDVTGQQGKVNYTTTGSGGSSLDYDVWASNEYEDIQGFEANISKEDLSWITGWINFNYLLKKSGYVGTEYVREDGFENPQDGLYGDSESQVQPQPKINGNLTLRTPHFKNNNSFTSILFGDWSFTLYGEWKAGDYFVWEPSTTRHNLQWPDYKMVDMKVNKNINIAGAEASLFIDISNIFNIKVNQISRGYAFTRDAGAGDYQNWRDFFNYMGSLRLSIYDDPEYDALRNQYEGMFLPGTDDIGDLRSQDKPYINDPNLPNWLFGEPRDIWVGLSIRF